MNFEWTDAQLELYEHALSFAKDLDCPAVASGEFPQ